MEDEKAAVRNLTALLKEVAPDMEAVAVLDSIRECVEWFSRFPAPDLVFMDIHLADGSAFEIFEHVSILCPVIFTTAYDEYALRAFKVNSIDYLLKPIGEDDMRQALGKLKILQTGNARPVEAVTLRHLLRALKRSESYKSHFLIPVRGDKLLPLSVEQILYFYIRGGVVKAVAGDVPLKDRHFFRGNEAFSAGQADASGLQEYTFPLTLDELTECLDPACFFRVNRQYLLSRRVICDLDLWFNGRLSVNLKVPATERILISKARASEFKDWFTGGSSLTE